MGKYKLKLIETGILLVFVLYFLDKFDLGYVWNAVILLAFLAIVYFFAMKEISE